MDATREYQSDLNDTWFPNDSRKCVEIQPYFINVLHEVLEDNPYTISESIRICRLVISMLGAVGNGMVIWLLGFCVQRNPFMTCILNLAIADLGLLISVMLQYDVSAFLPKSVHILEVSDFTSFLTYSAGQFLLSAISMDRCVAVFFPLWHRCHRPPRLTVIVCALMWVLSFLLATVTFIAVYFNENIPRLTQFFVNAVLCLPLVTVSTVALFIKVCFKQQQHRRGKLLTVLLLTLAFFLLFSFPLNVLLILSVYNNAHGDFLHNAILLTCLNSSVNLVVYFLVGRQRKTQRKETLKVILQKAFKEEKEEKEEEGRTEEDPAGT